MTLFYDGVQYEVEMEGDIEKINLLDDENDGNKKLPNKSKDFQESQWTDKVTHMFLDECIKRKMLICNPRIQKHKVFLAIHKQLKAKNYIFKVITLERKLRSMINHFILVCGNKRYPSSWQYYEKMKTLYPDLIYQERSKDPQPLAFVDEPTNSTANTNKDLRPPDGVCGEPKSSLQSPKLSHASQESLIAQLILKDCPSSALSGFTLGSKGTRQTKLHDNKKAAANIEKLRKEILSLEERRTEAIEKILLEMRQSNKLKEEMLELNIKLFEATKNMEEF